MSADVERFRPAVGYSNIASMTSDDKGNWVHVTDYEALAAERDAAIARAEAGEAKCDFLASVVVQETEAKIEARTALTEANARAAVAWNKAIEAAAVRGAVPCYEIRHVTLGDKVADAIRALRRDGGE